MSKIFETTTNTKKRILLPAGSKHSSALSVLHNHDTVLRLDPHLLSYTTLPSPANSPETKVYSVIDHVGALPKVLGLDKATSTQELTDKADGIALVVKASMGVVIKQTWTVKSDSGQLVVDFVSNLSGARLLAGALTKQLGQNWEAVSKTYLEKLAGA